MSSQGLTETGTAIISATRRSSRNQVRRGGGRDPDTTQLRATSLPAERGLSAPKSLIFSGGTESVKYNQSDALMDFQNPNQTSSNDLDTNLPTITYETINQI